MTSSAVPFFHLRVGQCKYELAPEAERRLQGPGLAVDDLARALIGAGIEPDELEALFVLADAAMYAAKHAGKNCFRHAPPRVQEGRPLDGLRTPAANEG